MLASRSGVSAVAVEALMNNVGWSNALRIRRLGQEHGIYDVYILEDVMPSTTVQVPVLMSLTQKRRLARKAKQANLTMGELLRQGGERFSPIEDPAVLDHMANQVIRSTTKTILAIDKTLAMVAESERRMAKKSAKGRVTEWDLRSACGMPLRAL